MPLGTYDAVYIALAFVVPGFILHSTESIFLTRRESVSQLSIFQFLALSAVNYAAWSWLVYLLNNAAVFRSSPTAAAVGWAWVILVGPILLGLLFGLASQKDWLHRLFRRMGLLPVHSLPTAWDWGFGKMAEPRWILVTMKDGSTVAGFFGSRSFASSDSSERDLYLEQQWDIDDEGKWTMQTAGKSILIPANEIRFVEFWQQEEAHP